MVGAVFGASVVVVDAFGAAVACEDAGLFVDVFLDFFAVVLALVEVFFGLQDPSAAIAAVQPAARAIGGGMFARLSLCGEDTAAPAALAVVVADDRFTAASAGATGFPAACVVLSRGSAAMALAAPGAPTTVSP